VESNGSLPPGGWLKVTCGLTACIPGSAPGPTVRNECGRTLSFYHPGPMTGSARNRRWYVLTSAFDRRRIHYTLPGLHVEKICIGRIPRHRHRLARHAHIPTSDTRDFLARNLARRCRCRGMGPLRRPCSNTPIQRRPWMQSEPIDRHAHTHAVSNC